MLKELVVFSSLILIIWIAGCLGQSGTSENQIKSPDINKSQGVFDNAKRLYEDYTWKLDLVNEIQNRTDALGTAATREMYIEWKRRNNESIEAGERLATYITEHRDVLDQYWISDVLVLIAKNKVTFERDNQALEQTINSLEQSKKLYGWRLNFYSIEGSREIGTLTFENKGLNLSNVKFRFVFYTDSGGLYAEDSLNLGDVATDKTIRKKVSLPTNFYRQTWSKEKMFLYINGSLEEVWLFEDDEWKELKTDKTN